MIGGSSLRHSDTKDGRKKIHNLLSHLPQQEQPFFFCTSAFCSRLPPCACKWLEIIGQAVLLTSCFLIEKKIQKTAHSNTLLSTRHASHVSLTRQHCVCLLQKDIVLLDMQKNPWQMISASQFLLYCNFYRLHYPETVLVWDCASSSSSTASFRVQLHLRACVQSSCTVMLSWHPLCL